MKRVLALMTIVSLGAFGCRPVIMGESVVEEGFHPGIELSLQRSSVSLSASAASIGEAVVLTATLRDQNGALYTAPKEIVWALADQSMGSLSKLTSSGGNYLAEFVGAKAGVASITASVGGRAIAGGPWVVTVSALPPSMAVAITSPAPGAFIHSQNDSTSFPVSGTCAGGQSVAVRVNGAVSGAGASCAGGVWSATIDSTVLAEGPHAIVAVISDGSGATVNSASVGVIKDVTPPVVTGLSDDGVPRTSKTWSWGCSESVCTYRFALDQVSGTNPSGVYGSTVTAAQITGTGTYYLHVQARDEAGNESAVVHVSAVLDNTPPDEPSGLSLVNPAVSPGNLSTPTIRVSGVVSGDTVAIFTDSGCALPALKASDTATGITIDLESSALDPGTHTFYARASDPLGNASPCSAASVTYEYDDSLPAVTGLSDDATPVKSKTWNWGCSKADCTYRFLVDTNPATDPSGAYGATATATQDTGTGTYYIHVQAKDPAGNESAVVHVSAVIDNTPPDEPSGLSLVNPATSPGNAATPTIRVSGVVIGDTVAIFTDSSCSMGELRASDAATGTTIDLVSSALVPGSYTFYAKSTDLAGNDSPCSAASIAYEYDNSAPSVTGLSDDANPTKSKTWNWGCSKAGCTYRFVVDTNAATIPDGAYGATATATQDTVTGTYYLHVQAIDPAGNESAVVHVSAVIDNTPPDEPSGLSLINPASSPGNVATPTIRVSGVVSGDTVSIFTDNGCAVPALKASDTATGTTIDLESSALDPGSHTFYAKATDVAGNDSPCSLASVTYEFDNAAPSVTGLSDDATPTKSKTWNWGCSKADCTYRFVVDTNPSTDPSGAYGATATATQDTVSGTYYLHVQAIDPAGNESAVVHVSAVIDNTAPDEPSALSLVNPATSPGGLATPTIRVSGVVSGDTVAIFTDSGCALPTLKASDTATGTTIDLESSALDPGSYSFYAKATDVAGNASSCSAAFVAYVYDNDLPAVTGLSSDGTPTKSKTWNWGCSKADCTYRFVVDTSPGTEPGGAYDSTATASQSVGDGIYYLHVQAKDLAGNESAVVHVSAVIDNTPPDEPSGLTLQNPASSPGNVSTPTIRVSGVVSGDTVAIFTDSGCAVPALKASDTASGTTIDLISSALDPGSYTFYAKSTDVAGNASPCTAASLAYEYDNVSPSVTGLSDDATPTKSKTWNWGCSKAGCTYRFVVDTNAATDPDGAYGATATATQDTVTGTYYLHVQAIDPAGNESAVVHVSAVIDNTPPDEPSGLTLQNPATSPGNVATPTIRVSGVVSGDTVSIYTDSGCAVPALKASDTASGATIDLISSALDPGSHTFYAKASDPLGNASPCTSASVAYEYDNSAPSVTGLSDDATPTKSKTWNWGCSKADCTYRFVVDTNPATDPDGVYGTTATTTQDTVTGTYYLHVQAKDAAGNESAVVHVSAVIDNTPPDEPSGLSLVNPAASPGNINNPTIRVSGVVSGDTVAIFTDASCSIGELRASDTASGTTIDLESSVLDPGAYTFYAKSTDVAGNASPCSLASVAYEYDDSNPAVTGLSNDGTPTKSKTWNWGCSKADCTYRFVVDTNAATDPDGAYGATATATQDTVTGTYYLHVQAKDAAGNESAVVHVSAVIDNTPPDEPSGLTLQNPASSPGNVSNPTIRVSGVVSGDTVAIFTDSGCALPSLKASDTAAGTTIDLESSALDPGSYSFYAKATDVAGNSSPCSAASVAYEYDNSAPSVTGLSDDSTPTQSKTWNWGCSKADCTYRFVVDTNAATNPGGAYGATATATQDTGTGTYYIHVQAKDPAGNESAVVHVSAVIDNTPPDEPGGLSLQNPASSPGNVSTPTIRVSGVVSGDTVAIFTDSGCAVPALKASDIATGATIDLESSALDPGSYSFYAKATDVAGNASPCSAASVAYEYDNSAPSVTGLSDDSTPTQSKTWNWGCSKADCTYRFVVDTNAATNPGGAYGATATATQDTGTGTYYIHVQAKDSAGNESAVVHVSAVIDNTPPNEPSGLTLQNPASSPGNVSNPTIRVSGVVSGDTVAIFTGSDCALPSLKASDTAAGTTIDLESSALDPGSYSFYAKATDVAGNASPCSAASVAYEYDNSAPSVTGLSDDASPTKSKTWNWGCSKADCTYRFVVDTNAATNPGGAYGATATATQDTGTGTYYIHVQAKDPAGNESAVVHVSAVIDNTPPNEPGGLTLQNPASSPGNVSNPTIRVSGVVSGDTVAIFTGSDCAIPSLRASDTAAGTTIDLESSALSPGSYSFYAKATDVAGNASPCSAASVAYEYDNSAPSVTGLSDDSTPTQSKTWNWGCSKADCAYRFVVDTSAGTNPGGAYGATATATQDTGTGTYYIHVQAKDPAGNESAVVHVSAVIDNTPPDEPSGLSLQNPASSPGNVATPTIRVSGVVSGDTVAIFTGSDCAIPSLRASDTAAGTTIDLESSALSPGSYSFYAKATDAAGNASPCSVASVAYEYDNSAPSVTGLSDDASPTKSKTWNWGCSKADCTYRFVVDTNAATNPGGAYGATATATQDTGTGTYYIHVQAKDSAGNESAVVHVSAVIDNTPPDEPSGLSLQNPASSPGNVSTPTIRVSGVVSGDTVAIFTDSSCSIGEIRATDTATGATIDLESSALDPGSYSFYAKATDVAGNSSPCSAASVAYEYDNSAPSVTGLSDDASPTKSKTWNWGCSKADCTYRFVVDTNAATNPGGAYGATATATQDTGTGTYYIHVQAKDGAGNESAVVHVSAVIDNTPPDEPSGLTLQNPASSPGNVSTPTIRVSGVVSGDTVAIFTDSGCAVPALKASDIATGATIDLESSALDPGSYSFYAKATDVAGNASPCSAASVAYEYDNSAPSVTGLSDDSTPTQSKTWNWGCSKADCTYRFVLDTNAATNPGGAYGATATATQDTGTGTYYIHVQAKDAAGNESAVVHVSAVIDNTPPDEPSGLSLQNPASSPGNVATPTVRVSGVVSGDTVAIFTGSDCAIPSLRASDTAAGATIDLESSALDPGSYSFYAKATDVAGNASPCSAASVAYEYDNSAPSVTGLSDDASPTKSKTWNWGCSKADCTYRFVVDTSAGTNPGGAYGATATATQDTGTGTYYIHVQAKDSAGNESAVVHVSAVIDNTPPNEPSGLSLQNPASSPGNVSAPTIRVSGVVSGDTVAIFTDSGCTVPAMKASDTASGATIDLESSALDPGSYTFYAKATDPAGNASPCSSASVAYEYDNSAPSVTGLADDSTYTKSKTWNWGCSKAGCTYRFVVDTNAATNPGGAYGATATATQDTGTGTYYIHVQAKDAAGNESSVVHVSALIDNTAPTQPGVISGPTVNGGSWWNSASCTPLFNWDASTDGASGLDRYDVAIGTSAGGTQVVDWTANGTTTSKQFCSLALSSGTTYHVSVRAFDNAGNTSERQASWVVDTGAPSTPGSVDDGTTSTSLTDTPTITWAASTDGVSDIDYYEVAIGTSAGGTQTMTWTGVGNTTSASFGSLSLSNGNTYYASVRAVDKAGNTSDVGQGDGWLVNAVNTTTIQIATGSDDVTLEKYDVSYWYPSKTAFGVGHWGDDGDFWYGYGGGLRFQNVAIPKDATIVSAKLRVVVSGDARDLSTGFSSKIRAEDASNPGTFSTLTDYNGRSRTVDFVSWNSADVPAGWVTGTVKDSPDISSLVQFLVNKADWTSGNAMVIFWDDHDALSELDKFFEVYSYEGSPGNAARLIIEWY